MGNYSKLTVFSKDSKLLLKLPEAEVNIELTMNDGAITIRAGQSDLPMGQIEEDTGITTVLLGISDLWKSKVGNHATHVVLDCQTIQYLIAIKSAAYLNGNVVLQCDEIEKVEMM